MEKHIHLKQISAFVDKQLSGYEADAVQFHLTQCSSCRTSYEEFSKITQLFQRAAVVAEPSPFLWQRISAQLAPLPAPVRGSWASALSFHRLVWVAAALATVVLGASMFIAEFRSIQLARRQAWNEIENMRLALNNLNAEINNPFRSLLTVDRNRNPFSMKRLSVESNPFRPIDAR